MRTTSRRRPHVGPPNEVVAVGPASPTITTQASPTTSITVGTPSTVGDTATFQNTTSVAPTGSVTFTLYSNSTCTASTGVSGSGAISTLVRRVIGVVLDGFTAPATGTYYWQASYAGDANNNAITTACGAANEVIVVGPGVADDHDAGRPDFDHRRHALDGE